ncbi:glycosyltransferase family 2 protein [Bizionia arctica]|uniref:Glycosyl transferase n=1 Tax=Bizionia arctica TaxID=1495645 RepID=A0A917GP20_9FLAO|nr:glycosyltransferase family 2 protein [Bizionia arctica]GGG53126.1 glycosyl transferase [Bizionia arctica]
MARNVYIIIVTYNGMQWLSKCLESCKAYSVVVVDNASTDETVSFIASNYPDITLFKQDKNLGFGQANNLGIKFALEQGAEQVFLLNQDAYLVDTVLDRLVNFQIDNPEYGVLSPVHITGDRKKLDKNFSNFMLKEKTGQFYSDFVLGSTLAEVYEVPFVNAAAWLLSRKCLETIGGFDPLFFHYGEDDNYCQRAIYHGIKIGVLPEVYVIHDREARKLAKSSFSSEAYYKNIEKTYKVVNGNINSENKIDFQLAKLRKTILMLQLRMKVERVLAYKKELSILLEMKDKVAKSRAVNKTEGIHYL